MTFGRILVALAAVFVLCAAPNASAFTTILDLSDGSGTVEITGSSVNISSTFTTSIADSDAYFNVADNPDTPFAFQVTATIFSEDFTERVIVGATATLNQLLTSPGVPVTSVAGTGLFGSVFPAFAQFFLSDIFVPDPSSATFNIRLQDPSFALLGDQIAAIDSPSFGWVAVEPTVIPLPAGMWLLLVDVAWMGSLGLFALTKRSRSYA